MELALLTERKASNYFQYLFQRRTLKKHSIKRSKKKFIPNQSNILAFESTTSDDLTIPPETSNNKSQSIESRQQKISPASSLDVFKVCHSTYIILKESDFKAIQSPSESFLLNLSKHISHWMRFHNLKYTPNKFTLANELKIMSASKTVPSSLLRESILSYFTSQTKI